MTKAKKTPTKKVTKKVVKKKSQSKLKKELDALVSRYVRLFYSDEQGLVECYTCGKVLPVKRMQCGHFVSRTYLRTRFDLRNLRVQCVGCNLYGHGKTADFATKLEEETPGITGELFKLARIPYPGYPYEKEIHKYKKLLLELEE